MMAGNGAPTGVFEPIGHFTRSYEVWRPRFEAKYAALGGEASFLGKATTDLVARPENGGAWLQSFEHGALCGDVPLGGVFEIHGAIYVKWVEVGGPSYGWPITDESAGRRDRCQRFQGGYISWNTDTGAHLHANGTVSTLTVAHLNIHSIRSRHRDTNVIGFLARVPGQPDATGHEGLGDFGVGDFDINKNVQFVADDPTAPLNVSWLLVNHGDGDTQELDDK